MNCLPIIIGASVFALAVVISILVIVLPHREPVQSEPDAGDHDFFAVPEKPRIDDGKPFKPDWN